jgi:Zn finger protein HypA/HybF involved in hydrogenase expression
MGYEKTAAGGKNMKSRIHKIECMRCGHSWIPRTDVIRQCPKCKSAWFDRPKASDIKKINLNGKIRKLGVVIGDAKQEAKENDIL